MQPGCPYASTLTYYVVVRMFFFLEGGGQGDPTKHEAKVKLQEEVGAEVGRCLDFELRLLLAPASELTDNMMET